MKPLPEELSNLRQAVASSQGWWRDGRPVSEEERAGLSEAARNECRWMSDPALVACLVEAEAQTTASYAT